MVPKIPQPLETVAAARDQVSISMRLQVTVHIQTMAAMETFIHVSYTQDNVSELGGGDTHL